jgi:hypothetical protein
MELSPALTRVFWCALALGGVSACVFVFSLNVLVNAHRRDMLSAVWISGSIMIAAGVAVLILLIQG